MSAYIVDKAHIDALATLYVKGPAGVVVSPFNAWMLELHWRDRLDGYKQQGETDADALGYLLWAENERSVAYRYPDDKPGELPGPVGLSSDDIINYHLSGWGRRLTVPEAFKAIKGYQYQSCEHPGWRQSDAYEITEALKDALIRYVPGYDDADTWSIS